MFCLHQKKVSTRNLSSILCNFKAPTKSCLVILVNIKGISVKQNIQTTGVLSECEELKNQA